VLPELLQTLGMAQSFYHKPKIAILDECTNGVTTNMEEKLCASVCAMGTSCITISHRPTLMAFHDTFLSLDGDVGASFSFIFCLLISRRIEFLDE